MLATHFVMLFTILSLEWKSSFWERARLRTLLECALVAGAPFPQLPAESRPLIFRFSRLESA